MITVFLFGCSVSETGLQEVEGVGLTYSEEFKEYDQLDERKDMKYYKPVPIDELKSYLPEQVKAAVNTIGSDRLPFQVDENKAFFITSKDKKGEIQNQIQLSYLSKSEYDQVRGFYIISITEVDENPLGNEDIPAGYDSIGNKLKKEMLTEDLPIYQQVLTTDSALLYTYYDYEETENRVMTVGTTANEFYAYYNGYVYHVGYSIDREKNDEEMQQKMLDLTREYILGADL